MSEETHEQNVFDMVDNNVKVLSRMKKMRRWIVEHRHSWHIMQRYCDFTTQLMGSLLAKVDTDEESKELSAWLDKVALDMGRRATMEAEERAGRL